MLAVRSLIRKEPRREDEPLNIITFSFDYEYECKVAEAGHNMYYWTSGYEFSWGAQQDKVPKNFIKMLPDNIPAYVDFDLILCPNRGVYNICNGLARHLHIPIICLEHDAPTEEYKTHNHQNWNNLSNIDGDINVFSSQKCRDGWGKMGYIAEITNESFIDVWNNILSQAADIVYTRQLVPQTYQRN